MNDTERLDWLQTLEGSGLISDDAGHWAVATSGFQNVPDDPPQDIRTTFWVGRSEWHKTIREAIDAAMKEEDE